MLDLFDQLVFFHFEERGVIKVYHSDDLVKLDVMGDGLVEIAFNIMVDL